MTQLFEERSKFFKERSKFFPGRGDPFEKGGIEREKSRIASLESISIYLNSVYYTPGIYAEGYIVFASSICPFVCLFVRLFVRYFPSRL